MPATRSSNAARPEMSLHWVLRSRDTPNRRDKHSAPGTTPHGRLHAHRAITFEHVFPARTDGCGHKTTLPNTLNAASHPDWRRLATLHSPARLFGDLVRETVRLSGTGLRARVFAWTQRPWQARSGPPSGLISLLPWSRGRGQPCAAFERVRRESRQTGVTTPCAPPTRTAYREHHSSATAFRNPRRRMRRIVPSRSWPCFASPAGQPDEVRPCLSGS